MPLVNDEALCLGMISGTSRDGVDAALVHIHNNQCDLLHANCVPYPPAIRDDLDELIARNERPSPGRAASLDEMLGRFFARVANELMMQAGVERNDVLVIGSHGQTVWHDPDSDRPISVQLGSGAVIARSTGVPAVTTFRKADMLAGGQGAPLAPLLHQQLLAQEDEVRGVVNIGGISNLTLLDGTTMKAGFDTGPGNCLMDAWINSHRGEAYDADGAWAASGAIITDLFERLSADGYFTRSAPKSTGLEYFNAAWLDRHLDGSEAAADVQATLSELTAVTIANEARKGNVERLLVCGGGVHNRHLMSRLRTHLRDTPVESSAQRGVDPDWLEAMLFAWLAFERVNDRHQDTSSITGAQRPVLLGKLILPPDPERARTIGA